MAEFVHHHIILDHKIPSKITANTVKKNIARDGNCCKPKSSLYLVVLSFVVLIIQVLMLGDVSGLLDWLIMMAMVPTTAFGVYNAYRVREANKYMYVGSPEIICLGSSSSSTTSAAPWTETSGLSEPWKSFINGCRRYESLLEKIPENDLVSDQMFFSTVEDIYTLFEHTYMTGQTIARHRMEREYAALRSAIEKFEEFIEKSSQIYASLRFTANGDRLDLIDRNLTEMNEVAQTKITSLIELENPASRKGSIEMGGASKKKKLATKQAVSHVSQHSKNLNS